MPLRIRPDTEFEITITPPRTAQSRTSWAQRPKMFRRLAPIEALRLRKHAAGEHWPSIVRLSKPGAGQLRVTWLRIYRELQVGGGITVPG